MIDLVIKVENRQVGEAVNLLMDNYKEQFAVFLNNVLKGETGGAADVAIIKDAQGVINVYQTAPDKGLVLGQVVALGPVELIQYKELAPDTKYVLFDGQNLTLFLKQPDGVTDIKIGRFTNLNEVATQIDSESVTTTIHTIKASIKNAEIERKKVEKKAKKLRKLQPQG